MAVTLRDLAQEVGVSVTTVSRALAGYGDVSAETRRKVQEAADSLGYQPNLTARRLKKQTTDTLGFIIPTSGPRFSDPFFSEIIAGIGNEAAEHDYDLLVSTHAPDSEEEWRAYQRAVRGGWVDGLIVVRTREEDRRIKLLCENRFPFVAFGRSGIECDFPYVDEDGAAGTRLLVQHFIELGHRQIGYIATPPGLMFGAYRLQGYLDTMADCGLPVRPEWLVAGDLTQQGGAQAVEPLLALSPRPTAIVCCNDLTAIGAMSRIRSSGLEVGSDIAIGGFDDIPPASYSHPPLTTVHQPIYHIGRLVCRLLIDFLLGKISSEPHIVLEPTLVVRASSGGNVL